jgi:hypothetical protein
MKRIYFLTLAIAGALLLAYRFRGPTVPVADPAARPSAPTAMEGAKFPAPPIPKPPPISDHGKAPRAAGLRGAPERREPTADQQHVLDEARKDDEDWEKQRGKFLETELKLSERELGDLEKARQSTANREAELMAGPVQGPEHETVVAKDLRENRAGYEAKLRSLLGPGRYKALLGFYRGNGRPDGVGAHLPLK